MTRFLVITLATLGLLIGAGQASAHARLRSSIPANAAQLARAPATLTLNFSEPARLTVLKLSRSGQPIPLSLEPDAKAAARIVVPLPALNSGTYEVEWRVIAQDDGHVTHGSFAFTITGS